MNAEHGPESHRLDVDLPEQSQVLEVIEGHPSGAVPVVLGLAETVAEPAQVLAQGSEMTLRMEKSGRSHTSTSVQR